jgi:hypothetical protein
MTAKKEKPIFKTGQETFNRLSPMPDPVDLSDGRELLITKWIPKANEITLNGSDFIEVEIEGHVHLK